jgi:hypothetical protein
MMVQIDPFPDFGRTNPANAYFSFFDNQYPETLSHWSANSVITPKIEVHHHLFRPIDLNAATAELIL